MSAVAGTRVVLGRTGLEISRIGCGGWAAGGSHWFHGWSQQDDRDSAAAIERALEAGVNWIDTAAVYGFGHSEEVIGRTLAGVRERPLLFTKCGPLPDPGGRLRFSLRRESILRELEGSLLRLGVDRIDLYQLHRPEPPGELEEGWSTLAELKEQGVVGHIGLSNVTAEQVRELDEIAAVGTIQPPYSLLRREAEEDLLPFASSRGIGVLGYSPLASGLLTGGMTRERLASLPPTDWRRNDDRFAEPTLTRGLETVERLRDLAARYATSPGALAIAWALRNPAVHGVIVGFRTAAQVDALARADSLVLADGDAAALEAAAGRPSP